MLCMCHAYVTVHVNPAAIKSQGQVHVNPVPSKNQSQKSMPCIHSSLAPFCCFSGGVVWNCQNLLATERR